MPVYKILDRGVRRARYFCVNGWISYPFAPYRKSPALLTHCPAHRAGRDRLHRLHQPGAGSDARCVGAIHQGARRSGRSRGTLEFRQAPDRGAGLPGRITDARKALLRQFLDGMGRERALLLADEDAVTVNIHPAVGSADRDADRPLRGLVRLPEEAPRAPRGETPSRWRWDRPERRCPDGRFPPAPNAEFPWGFASV